jgi:hypothetical protein
MRLYQVKEFYRSHLTLQLFLQLLQSFHVTLLHWPFNAQPFLLIRLRNHMEMYMVNFLVRQSSIIL